MSADTTPTPQRLDEIRERAERATPGPWRAGSPSFRCRLEHSPHGQGKCVYSFEGWRDDSGKIYRDNDPTVSGDEVMIAGTWDYEYGGIFSDADRAFIAAAREDVPFLLSLVEAQRGKIAEAESALKAQLRYLAALAEQIENDAGKAVRFGLIYQADEVLRAALASIGGGKC